MGPWPTTPVYDASLPGPVVTDDTGCSSAGTCSCRCDSKYMGSCQKNDHCYVHGRGCHRGCSS